MTTRSCTELGAAMIALRVAELRVLAAATKAAASVETGLETSTSRFVTRNIHPDAARTLREFASQVIDTEDGSRCGGVW